MAATISLRIDKNLVLQSERESRIQHRSRTKQLEFWAKLGKAISPYLDMADAVAVSQGIKTIKLEPLPSVQSAPVDPDTVFDELEKERADGKLKKKITAAKIYYEASKTHPGYLDQVNTLTNKRLTGIFEDGEFKALS